MCSPGRGAENWISKYACLPIPTAGLLLPIDVISCAYSKIVRRAGDIVKTIARPVRLTAAGKLPSSLI